jgi:four helix bundle protein
MKMENGKPHRRFEEIPVWIKARELCKDIYSATKDMKFGKDRGFVDQITRASVSVAL